MTQFFILVEDEEIMHELSMGRCPPQIQDMARTMCQWGLIDLQVENVHKPDQRAPRKAPKRRKRAA